MSKKALVLSILLSVFGGSLAMATPGDIGCTGNLNGKKIDLLLGYDVHGQDEPALIQVSEDGKVVFESHDVSLSLEVFAADPNNPVIEAVTWEASDEESTAIVRVPEQGKGELSVVLTVETDSGLFKVNELEMGCDI